MVLDVLKSIILTSLGGLSAAAMTWGLINTGNDPYGLSFAIFGLLAYVIAWMIALYSVSQ